MSRREQEELMRRHYIVDAAETLFFSRGYATTTMDDVAKAAEFSKRTLYKYYRSKHQLQLEIVCRAFNTINTMLQISAKNHQTSTGLATLMASGQTYSQFTKEHPHYSNAIARYETLETDYSKPADITRACYAAGDTTLHYFETAMQKGMNDGSIRADLDVRKTIFIIWSSFTGLAGTLSRKARFIQETYQMNASEAFDLFFEFITRSLSTVL